MSKRSSLYAFSSIFVRKLQYLRRIHILRHHFKHISKIGWWLKYVVWYFCVSRDEFLKNEILSYHHILSTHILRCLRWAVLFCNLQLTENIFENIFSTSRIYLKIKIFRICSSCWWSYRKIKCRVECYLWCQLEIF